VLERLDHIDLRVPSLAQAETFFVALGLTVTTRYPGERGSIEMSLPGDAQVFLEVREDPTVSTTTVDHIAFSTSDSASTVVSLSDAGLTFTKKHHLVAATGRTVSNVVDPTGGKWQLAEQPE